MFASKRLTGYHKTVDIDARQKARASASIKLAKSRRAEMISKRRAAPEAAVPAAAAAAAASESVSAGLPADLSMDHLPQYIAAIQSGVEATVLAGTSAIRRLLSKSSQPPVEPVLAAGAGPLLTALLQHTNPKIVFEAAWCMTNIGSTDQTERVVECGAVPHLVKLLRSPHENVREQAIWCIGNIVGDGPKLRDMLLDTPDCVDALILNIQNPANVTLLRNATWVLSNFCRGKPKADAGKVGPVIGVLATMLRSSDKDVLADALWGLSYISDGSSSFTGQLVASGDALVRIVGLLKHERPGVVIPALRTIGNIVSSTDEHTEAAIDAGCLVDMARLVCSDKRNIRREACWAASNIAAGTKSQIARLVSTPGMMANIVYQAIHAEFHVQKEAAWVLSNVTNSGKPIDVAAMIEAGAFKAMVALIRLNEPTVCSLMLTAVYDAFVKGDTLGKLQDWIDAFERAEGPEVVDAMQDHESKKVYDAAVRLMESFLGEEEDEAGEGGEEEAGTSLDIVPAGAQQAAAAMSGFGAPSTVSNAVAPGFKAQPAANPFAAVGTGGFGAVPQAAAAPAQAGGFGFGTMGFG